MSVITSDEFGTVFGIQEALFILKTRKPGRQYSEKFLVTDSAFFPLKIGADFCSRSGTPSIDKYSLSSWYVSISLL